MVLEIAGGILLAYLAIFFVAPIFFSVLGVIMEEAVIPLCEESGKGISWLYKYCSMGIKWFRKLRWYYKLSALIICVIVGLLFKWIEVLFVSYIFFCILCVEAWYKFCTWLEKRNKNPLKKDFESI